MRYNMISDYYRQQKEKQIEQELIWLEQEVLYEATRRNYKNRVWYKRPNKTNRDF